MTMPGPLSSRLVRGEFLARVGDARRHLREVQLEATWLVRELAQLRDGLPEGPARGVAAELVERMIDLVGAAGRGLAVVANGDELTAMAERLLGGRSP